MASAARQTIAAVAQVGGACRSIGRLVNVGVSGIPSPAPAATATRSAAAAGGAEEIALVGSLFAPAPAPAQAGPGPAAPVLDLPAGGPQPAIVGPGLGGGNGLTDVSTLAAISIGVMLFALTAFAVNALAGAGAGLDRRSSLFRGERQGPGVRSNVIAIAALALSLAGWGALTLWVLLSGG